MVIPAVLRGDLGATIHLDRAAAVLADMGLTVSDLVRIVLTKVAKEKALPFEMRVPNKLIK